LKLHDVPSIVYTSFRTLAVISSQFIELDAHQYQFFFTGMK
jgi:hypothetical protein